MPYTTKSTNRAIALAGASLVLSCLLAGTLTGCSKSDPAKPAQPAGDVRVDTYADILGVVAALPVEGKPGTEFKVHHEHIPAFKTKTGEVFVTADGVPGMKSMSMPFPVGEGVSIDGIEVGDPIRFTFEVRWGSTPPWRVTKLEKLEPGTEIDFGNKVENAAPTTTTDDHAGHDHSGHDHP